MSDNGYFKCPNRIAQDSSISNAAFRVYCFIRSMENKDFIFSTRSIAIALKQSPTTVKTAIQELEFKGYLQRDQQEHFNGRFGHVPYTVF